MKQASILLALAVFAAGAVAQPAPDTVVETQLAPRSVKLQAQRLLQTRSPASAQAAAAPPAERLLQARALIDAGRAAGDPRLLGLAQVQLAGLDSAEALVLAATIEQSQHRFDGARTLLDRALAADSAHMQARLTRATVALVLGRHADAARDCTQIGAAPVAAVCSASVDAATGRNAQALAALLATAQRHPPLAGWALSLAGEVQMQMGATEAAIRSFSAALAQGDDLYTRVALADALLAAGRAAAAQAALASAPPTDAVLLRRWQATRALGQPDAALAERLQQRFAVDAARAGADAPLHLREAALFALERADHGLALQLAQQNWAQQREPADALLLARAARAAGDATTLRELRAWIRRTGLDDRRIARELGVLTALPARSVSTRTDTLAAPEPRT